VGALRDVVVTPGGGFAAVVAEPGGVQRTLEPGGGLRLAAASAA
jgi:hypothetical protein